MESCLHSRIFPGTVAKPHSGFTFAVLQDFYLQTLTSKKSAYDYISAIRRKTNNVFSKKVPVSVHVHVSVDSSTNSHVGCVPFISSDSMNLDCIDNVQMWQPSTWDRSILPQLTSRLCSCSLLLLS